MNVIKLSQTDYDESCYHGCGIGCLDVQEGRIVGAGYGWSKDRGGLSEMPVTSECSQSNPPPFEFEDGTVRLFGSFSCWEFITF